MIMDVRADDNCRLWTAKPAGEPLIMCHGGPGYVGYVRFSRRPAGGAPAGHPLGSARRRPVRAPGTVLDGPLGRRPGRGPRRASQGRPRESSTVRALVGVVQWSAEFGDGREKEHAEEMATPWSGINQDCYTQIWAELERTWHEDELFLEQAIHPRRTLGNTAAIWCTHAAQRTRTGTAADHPRRGCRRTPARPRPQAELSGDGRDPHHLGARRRQGRPDGGRADGGGARGADPR